MRRKPKFSLPSKLPPQKFPYDVSTLGSAIDGNTIWLHQVGKSDTEDTILQYARYLTLFRKLNSKQKKGK